jgi:hypothetical protein
VSQRARKLAVRAAPLITLLLVACSRADAQSHPVSSSSWAKKDYISMLEPHFSQLQIGFRRVEQCQQVDTASCRTYLAQLDQQIVDLDHDLNKYPAPPCESTGDHQLRSFVGIEHGALTLAIRAIDQGQPQLLPGATQEMKDAAPYLDRATMAINSARC